MEIMQLSCFDPLLCPALNRVHPGPLPMGEGMYFSGFAVLSPGAVVFLYNESPPDYGNVADIYKQLSHSMERGNGVSRHSRYPSWHKRM